MGSFGNISKIIDAEKEQTDRVTREGVCIYCGTVIKTTLRKDIDGIRYYFNKTITCPVCSENIKMEVV